MFWVTMEDDDDFNMARAQAALVMAFSGRSRIATIIALLHAGDDNDETMRVSAQRAKTATRFVCASRRRLAALMDSDNDGTFYRTDQVACSFVLVFVHVIIRLEVVLLAGSACSSNAARQLRSWYARTSSQQARTCA